MTANPPPPRLKATINASIEAIIFDCDGTLVDSETPGLDVLHELAQAEGISFSRAEAHAQFRGVRIDDCIDWILSQRANRLSSVPAASAAALPVQRGASLAPNDVRAGESAAHFRTRFLQQFRHASTQRFREGISALPGAAELLARLQRPFCVATNGPREKAELTLRLTGLRDYFGAHVYSAYEVGSFKPDPGLFLHAAAALATPPAACAVIEDSLPGLQAGVAAGMQVFSLHPPAGLPAALAARLVFIESLADFDRRLHG
ncbi:HAD family hydrolase [Rhodocyclus gracilis]|uniref:HAD family hydrolase n=1 Tax=Rhodocyclus gracilis TaxID=2929842 RepID=UPI0012956BCD|nr:HAD-IA family hydrolase [Rhodocyclus gracilis]